MSAETLPVEPGASRSPWNSLEVAKIVMSAATPLALFAIGFVVTQQVARQEKQEKDRQAEATEKREDRAAATKLALDEQVRREAFEQSRQLRDLADRREAELRREGFVREKSLRDEAFRREEAVRRETLARGEEAQIVQRRIEFWEKVSEKFAKFDRAIDRVMTGQGNAAEVEMTLREIDDVFAFYRPYFSAEFEDRYEKFKSGVRDFMARAARKDQATGLIAIDGVSIACNGYLTLRDMAAMEVAQSIGLARNVEGIPATLQRRVSECERRVKDAIKEVQRR